MNDISRRLEILLEVTPMDVARELLVEILNIEGENIFPMEDYEELFGEDVDTNKVRILDGYIIRNLGIIKHYLAKENDPDFLSYLPFEYMLGAISAKTGVSELALDSWFWEREEAFRKI